MFPSTLALSCVAHAHGAGVSTDAAVELFKRAISSPPDVEHFVVVQRNLRGAQPPPGVRLQIPNPTNATQEIFQGARSGTNFFLSTLPTTNALQTAAGSSFVIGRVGSRSYHFNLNTVTYTHDQSVSPSSGPLAAAVDSFYSIVSQSLNMGLAGIQPGTVSWDGEDFTAMRIDNSPMFGHLELSNGLPHVLSISTTNGEPPFKFCTYSYPTPLAALGGFPAKTTISRRCQEGLCPFLDLEILDIKLAEAGLPEGFFSELQHITSSIRHTNIFSNGVLFAISPQGEVTKAPVPVPVVHAPNRRAFLIIVVICAISVAFPLVAWRQNKSKNKQKTNYVHNNENINESP